jgi:hypothetical protein
MPIAVRIEMTDLVRPARMHLLPRVILCMETKESHAGYCWFSKLENLRFKKKKRLIIDDLNQLKQLQLFDK